jgi:uncharacterized protein YdeI (YjbR/CyaY-like superfamily)
MSEALGEKEISGGVVHDLPADLKKALISDAKALQTWEDITPLARNEWICWVESAKKARSRTRRIEWGCSSRRVAYTFGKAGRAHDLRYSGHGHRR